MSGSRDSRKSASTQPVRVRLAARLAQLEQRAGRIESDLRKPQEADSEERAIELENEQVLERLDASTLEEIRQLRAAIARVDSGSYGRCSGCGSSIEPRRLESLPYTEVCSECAS